MKATTLFFIFLVLLVPAVGKAYTNETEWNSKNIKIALATIPLAYMSEIMLHEGSHALTGTIYGLELERISFFPDYVDLGGGKKKFYLGHVKFKDRHLASPAESAHISMAPYIMHAILFSTSEVLFETGVVPHDSYVAPILFMMGEVAPWVSFTKSVIKSADFENFEESTGVHPGITRSVGVMISIVGACLIVRRGMKIFRKPAIRPKKSFLKIMPALGRGQAGLALQLNF
tara:strand:+ start:1500 stop:2192 length:693 start_codon:yes stop_codon:yes gene_type:complete